MSWYLTIGVNQPKEPGGLCLLCGLQRSWESNFFPEKIAWSIQLSQIITGIFFYTNSYDWHVDHSSLLLIFYNHMSMQIHVRQ